MAPPVILLILHVAKSTTNPSIFLNNALHCIFVVFLLPDPTPDICIWQGWPLNPASLAYWFLINEICAPVSHWTVHRLLLMSGILWIISCFLLPPSLWGGSWTSFLGVTWRRGLPLNSIGLLQTCDCWTSFLGVTWRRGLPPQLCRAFANMRLDGCISLFFSTVNNSSPVVYGCVRHTDRWNSALVGTSFFSSSLVLTAQLCHGSSRSCRCLVPQSTIFLFVSSFGVGLGEDMKRTLIVRDAGQVCNGVDKGSMHESGGRNPREGPSPSSHACMFLLLSRVQTVHWPLVSFINCVTSFINNLILFISRLSWVSTSKRNKLVS